VFQGTAAALPCELPVEGVRPGLARGAPKQQLRSKAGAAAVAAPEGVWAPFSKYQQAWARRVAAQRQRRMAAEAGVRA
jgi:hypothetical protein